MAHDFAALLSAKRGDAATGLIDSKVGQFGGLISRNAAAKLLCIEQGICQEEKIPLSEARAAQQPFSFTAKITRVFPLQQFPGSPDRSIRMAVSDKSASATVVLWNEQADRLFGEISLFDIVQFTGAHFRSGEISIGRQGGMKVLQKFPLSPLSSLKGGALSAKGRVSKVEIGGDRAFSFFIEGEGASVEVKAWQEGGADFPIPSNGDNVLLENAFFQKGALHISGVSRMVLLGSQHDKEGLLEGISLSPSGDGLEFMIGGDRLFAPLKHGLSVLGVRFLPEGVSPADAAPLLSGGFCGRKAVYSSEAGKLLKMRLI